MGVLSVIYRGCADNKRWEGLDIDYLGCKEQEYLGWNNERANWCLCDTDDCNAETMADLANVTTTEIPGEILNLPPKAKESVIPNKNSGAVPNVTPVATISNVTLNQVSMIVPSVNITSSTLTFLSHFMNVTSRIITDNSLSSTTSPVQNITGSMLTSNSDTTEVTSMQDIPVVNTYSGNVSDGSTPGFVTTTNTPKMSSPFAEHTALREGPKSNTSLSVTEDVSVTIAGTVPTPENLNETYLYGPTGADSPSTEVETRLVDTGNHTVDKTSANPPKSNTSPPNNPTPANLSNELTPSLSEKIMRSRKSKPFWLKPGLLSLFRINHGVDTLDDFHGQTKKLHSFRIMQAIPTPTSVGQFQGALQNGNNDVINPTDTNTNFNPEHDSSKNPISLQGVARSSLGSAETFHQAFVDDSAYVNDEPTQLQGADTDGEFTWKSVLSVISTSVHAPASEKGASARVPSNPNYAHQPSNPKHTGVPSNQKQTNSPMVTNWQLAHSSEVFADQAGIVLVPTRVDSTTIPTTTDVDLRSIVTSRRHTKKSTTTPPVVEHIGPSGKYISKLRIVMWFETITWFADSRTRARKK